ncbi:hypothetical protein [Paraburkholderia tropica]|uniref:hypothetical protein n=1 Tax=Paraburkholderia tropica TaxID=92647 RepID=UPI0007ED0831|nr:hypothetical protein [Paraburkholderia tropica]OBR53738.1 hypothetical protein A6456_12455 [Paraburkholderia tropica]
MTTLPMLVLLGVLAVLLFLCNRWSIRLLVASMSGDWRDKKQLVKAGGAHFTNIAVMVLIGFLWVFVATVLNLSDVLHEKGLPSIAFFLAVGNPVLLFIAMLMYRF